MDINPSSSKERSDRSESGGNPVDTYRVMVVEDSVVIRGLICKLLESDSQIKILHSVADGEAAIRALKRIPVDVIILDIEMPVMDGMTALPKLLEIDPAVKIIMASTLTVRNAEISMRALELGAADYVPKPMTSRELTAAVDFKQELVAKVKALAPVARRIGVRPPPPSAPGAEATPFRASQTVKSDVVRDAQAVTAATSTGKAERSPIYSVLAAGGLKPSISLRTNPIVKPDVIAIGSSTGGPQALLKMIKQLGSGLNQSIVLTQHMPPSFTTILAEHINKQCAVPCAEAKDGDALEAGKILLAPGDFHMTIVRGAGGKPVIKLNQNPPENFCRPAVDPMLRSLIPIFGNRILVVMLTGMGQDGWKGSDEVVKAGGSVIAQDEASSVVWGMPGAVATGGLCTAVLPLSDMGDYIRKVATGLRS